MAVTNLLQWKKLYRDIPFCDDGLLSTYLQLAFAAAYQDGESKYYKYKNNVKENQIVGGVVGLKSICGIKNRNKLMNNLEELKKLSLIDFKIEKNRKTTVEVNHLHHFERDKITASCHATQGYGFVGIDTCVPDLFVSDHYSFSENDALIDLWFHTTFGDHLNIFSYLFPCVEFDQKTALTLDYLAERWNWNKSKVSRFFKKHSEKYSLIKLPCSCGSLIFNNIFPVDKSVKKPTEDQIFEICKKLRFLEAEKKNSVTKKTSENEKINKLIKKYTQTIIAELLADVEKNKTKQKKPITSDKTRRIKTFIKQKIYSLKHPAQMSVCSGYSDHFDYRKRLLSLKTNEIFSVKNLILQKLKVGYRLLNHQNINTEINVLLESLFYDTVEIVYCGDYYHLINCQI